MQKPTRVALIGSGYWGKNFARILKGKGALAAICDINVAAAGPIAAAVGVPLVSSLTEILADPAISAVVVATPATTHYQVVRQALIAGKDVFVEKPLALDVVEAIELGELAAQQGRVLMVGHLLRYHPAFIRLAEMVAGGEIGRLSYIYSNRLNIGKLRREENVLWSFAPHDISMILKLAGAMPEQVTALGHCYLHENIADVTMTHLQFASGLRAHVFVSWLHPVKEQKLTIVGDNGMLVFDDTQPWAEKLVLYRHKIHWRDGVPIADKAQGEPVALTASEPLGAEIDHFLDCIDRRTTPDTDSQEAIRVLRVLTAAQLSMETGKPENMP